jgi:ABC-type Fe3+ transport system permease subunit
MTDKTSFPPLRDLPPGRHDLRKQYLLAEIARESNPRRLSWRGSLGPIHPLVAVPAAAAICVMVIALVVPGFLGHSGSKGNLNVAQPSPLTLRYVRSDGVLSAIPMTVTALSRGATAQIRVVRGTKHSTVVFERSGRIRKAVPSTWLGRSIMRFTWPLVLRPAAWKGGCGHARYRIKVLIKEPHAGKALTSTSFFSCR